jgi:hypothetical protein
MIAKGTFQKPRMPSVIRRSSKKAPLCSGGGFRTRDNVNFGYGY